jgi:hypothetical protein
MEKDEIEYIAENGCPMMKKCRDCVLVSLCNTEFEKSDLITRHECSHIVSTNILSNLNKIEIWKNLSG